MLQKCNMPSIHQADWSNVRHVTSSMQRLRKFTFSFLRTHKLRIIIRVTQTMKCHRLVFSCHWQWHLVPLAILLIFPNNDDKNFLPVCLMSIINAKEVTRQFVSAICWTHFLNLNCIKTLTAAFWIKDGATLTKLQAFFFFFHENCFCHNLKTNQIKYIKVYISRKGIHKESI